MFSMGDVVAYLCAAFVWTPSDIIVGVLWELYRHREVVSKEPR